MDDQHELAGIGHNSGSDPVDLGLNQPAPGPSDGVGTPEPVPPALTEAELLIDPDTLDQCRAKATEFAIVAAEWLTVKEITSAAQSGRLADFISGARSTFKVMDGLRKDAKQPYDAKAALIQSYFATSLEKVTRSVERVKPLQEAWLKAETARIAKEKAELAETARIAKEKAEADLLAAQASGDIGAEVEAEAAAKEATQMEKAAAKPARATSASASGAGKAQGLRRHPVVSLVNQRLALAEFHSAPELTECLIGLAQRRANAAGVDAIAAGNVKIPGFEVTLMEKL